MLKKLLVLFGANLVWYILYWNRLVNSIIMQQPITETPQFWTTRTVAYVIEVLPEIYISKFFIFPVQTQTT